MQIGVLCINPNLTKAHEEIDLPWADTFQGFTSFVNYFLKVRMPAQSFSTHEDGRQEQIENRAWVSLAQNAEVTVHKTEPKR